MEENEDFKAALKETIATLLPAIREMVQ
jgi:hypothetical protein